VPGKAWRGKRFKGQQFIPGKGWRGGLGKLDSEPVMLAMDEPMLIAGLDNVPGKAWRGKRYKGQQFIPGKGWR